MFGGSVNHRAQAKQDGYTKNDREIDDFRHRSRPERSALQRLRGEVRLGKLQRIAEITQHVIERLPVLHPFGNVRAELLRDLIPQWQVARHVIDDRLDVSVGCHFLSSFPSSFAIAVANVVHSDLRRVSSSRPVGVSR